jgi:hypothetical protein
MKIAILSIVLAAIVFVGGCNMDNKAATPQTFSNVSVRTASSPAAKFPTGSKYAFVKFASESEQGDEASLIYERIQKSLNSELKKKGYKPGGYSDVNFFVSYVIGLQQEINVLVNESKTQGNEWIAAIVVPNDYVTGALLVQVIDAKTMEPVWLGVFNADITIASVSEKEKQERVGYAVQNLLKAFPPK